MGGESNVLMTQAELVLSYWSCAEWNCASTWYQQDGLEFVREVLFAWADYFQEEG